MANVGGWILWTRGTGALGGGGRWRRGRRCRDRVATSARTAHQQCGEGSDKRPHHDPPLTAWRLGVLQLFLFDELNDEWLSHEFRLEKPSGSIRAHVHRERHPRAGHVDTESLKRAGRNRSEERRVGKECRSRVAE